MKLINYNTIIKQLSIQILNKLNSKGEIDFNNRVKLYHNTNKIEGVNNIRTILYNNIHIGKTQYYTDIYNITTTNKDKQTKQQNKHTIKKTAYTNIASDRNEFEF